MTCTPNEKLATRIGAGLVEGGSYAAAIAVAGVGVGATTPGSVAIIAGGNIAAECIRSICSDDALGDVGTVTMHEAGGIGIRIAASAIPVGGTAGKLIVEGTVGAYEVATGKFDIPVNGLSEQPQTGISLISSAEAAETPHFSLNGGEPRKLFPEHLPELTKEAKEALHAQSAEARKSVVAANHQDTENTKGHGLATGKAPFLENGIY